MSSCIVTCVYDLESRSPEYFHRSGAEYACMLEYHRVFNVPVYCFTEEHIVHLLPDFAIPIVLPFEQLPTHKLIKEHGKGYDNVMIGDSVHPGHRLYSIVTNSKIFLMSMLDKEYDTYVWIDSGIEHGDPVPDHVAIETYNNIITSTKSHLNIINYPTSINLDKNMYNVASGIFSLKKKDIKLLLESYKELLEQCYNIGYICLEEQIFTMLYMRHGSDMFDISFTDYRVLSNGKYYRTDYRVILNNIYYAPISISIDICNRFLDSISSGSTRISPQDLLEYLIHIYVKLRDVRIERIFKHILVYKNYVNDPKYKGRYNAVEKLQQHNITLDKLQHVELCNSMQEYLIRYPYERTIIRTII